MSHPGFFSAVEKKVCVQLLKMMIALLDSPCKFTMMKFYYVTEKINNKMFLIKMAATKLFSSWTTLNIDFTSFVSRDFMEGEAEHSF